MTPYIVTGASVLLAVALAYFLGRYDGRKVRSHIAHDRAALVMSHLPLRRESSPCQSGQLGQSGPHQ